MGLRPGLNEQGKVEGRLQHEMAVRFGVGVGIRVRVRVRLGLG